MANQTKPTLTSADIDLLRSIFATKDDVSKLPTRDDLVKKLTPIKKDIKKIKHDQDTIISFFDDQTIRLEKRVKRIENHLDLPPLNPSA